MTADQVLVMNNAQGTILGIAITLVVIAAYWAPSIVALIRHHRVAQVIIVNTLLGWTTIGWIVALVMAAGPRQATVYAVTSGPAPSPERPPKTPDDLGS